MYSEPKITIDFKEYQELLEIKRKGELEKGEQVTEEELSRVINLLIRQHSHTMSTPHLDRELESFCKEAGIEVGYGRGGLSEHEPFITIRKIKK